MKKANKRNQTDIFEYGASAQKNQAGAGHASGRTVLSPFLRIALLLTLCIATLGFTACGKDSGQKTASPSFEASSQPEETVELTEEEKKLARLSEQRYQDSERLIEVLGLKTYKKIKSERHVDKALKGKVYLVLFLQLWNDGQEQFYFNPYQFSAKVDGKKFENTFLMNEPENYPTVFQNVEAGSRAAGFVAWLVPEDWKKLHVEYQGFDPGKKALMKMDFTKNDLLTPYEYDPRVYE